MRQPHADNVPPSSRPPLSAQQVHDDLHALASTKQRDFQAKLIPTVDKGDMLGIPVPALRQLAQRYKRTHNVAPYLDILPHRYYEELLLHGALLDDKAPFDEVLLRVEQLLPHLHDWATCDTLEAKALRSDRPALLAAVTRWLTSSHEYTVRFGLVMLKQHFLDADFGETALELAAAVNRPEYYIRMAQAWLFAEALVRVPEPALPYITEHRLPDWVHNKSIQKACESRRITPEQTVSLRALRVARAR